MRKIYYGRELYHNSTNQRDDHKYIERISVGDHFRYFYDQASLAAYNAAKAASDSVTNTVNGVNNYFKGKNAIKEQSKLRNKNDRNIELARQGQTANQFGRGVAVVRRTVNNGIAPIIKGAKAASDAANKAIGDAQKAYKDFNTQLKYDSATRKWSKLRNSNEQNIELARQGKSSNPENRAKAIQARDRRDMIKNIISFGNSIPKTEEKKNDSIVIPNPPKPSTSNNKPKTDNSIKPVLSEKTEEKKKDLLKSYTDYYEKQYIKEGADPADAKRWAKDAARKRIKEDFK